MSDSKYEVVTADEGYLTVLPKPTRAELIAHYNDQYYGGKIDGHNPFTHVYTDAEIEHKSLPFVEALAVAGSGGKHYLDLGCGEGFGLDFFDRLGWSVRGVDFLADGVEKNVPHLRDRVEVCDIFDWFDIAIARGDSYDLITANNVLEHVIDPLALLRSVKALLSPTGVARILVPNDGSWLHELLIERGDAQPGFFLAPPEHLNYFTREPLIALARRAELDPFLVLGDFPVELFLFDPNANYYTDRSRRGAHFARVAFELNLWKRRGIDALIAYRKATADAGIGRQLIVYLRRPA